MTRFASCFLAMTAASALSACVYGPPPPGYYGPPPGAYGAADYDDPCFNDPAYCDYAYFEGPIWWEGTWYEGPHRWRDMDGRREFWVHGGWHGDARVGEHGRWGGPGRWHPQ